MYIDNKCAVKIGTMETTSSPKVEDKQLLLLLQKQLDHLQKFCQTWALTVNLEKT